METPLPLTPAAPLSDTEDAHKIGHKGSRSQRIEVITRGERRRVWTPEQKREIVAESFGPDLTPTEVVRKHGISSGQLYTWRQRLLSGPMTVLSRSAPGCQSAFNSFQVTASKSFHLVSPISAVSCAV
jgi:hypothetical protein